MSAGGPQESLVDFLDSGFTSLPVELADQAPRIADRELPQYGMLPEWVGAQPDEVEYDRFRRFQYDKIYFYPRNTGDNDIEYFPIEFRTYVYYVGGVPSDVRDHLRDVVNPHLRTLFNTGVYQGWMDGYEFEAHASNVEYDTVAADEASNLGVGQWEVLVNQEGTVTGAASGLFDPWKLVQEQDPPQESQWSVSLNEPRGAYELAPGAEERNRLRDDPKRVFVNGRFIGQTSASRGTVWLKGEYDTQSGTYMDSGTGQQMSSRQTLIDKAGMHPNELADGGSVYKVSEGPTRIDLVTTQQRTPDDFDPLDPEVQDPTVSVEMRLDEDGTDFEVRRDQGDSLGMYPAPTERRITRKTDWPTTPI